MTSISPADFNLLKAAYSVNEAISVTTIKRTSLYAAIKSGELRATKYGNKTLFLAADLASFLASLPAITTQKSGVGK